MYSVFVFTSVWTFDKQHLPFQHGSFVIFQATFYHRMHKLS